MLDQVVVGILLLSPPVDCVQKGHQLTMVHLLEEEPRHDVGSQGTPSNSAGNSDGPSNSASGGVSTGNIITGFTGTGSINMPTVKEAKILELNCPQREQTYFLITLLTSGVTVSASIYTAVELDDLTPISEFEQNHGMDTVRLSIDSGCWFLKTL